MSANPARKIARSHRGGTSLRKRRKQNPFADLASVFTSALQPAPAWAGKAPTASSRWCPVHKQWEDPFAPVDGAPA